MRLTSKFLVSGVALALHLTACSPSYQGGFNKTERSKDGGAEVDGGGNPSDSDGGTGADGTGAGGVKKPDNLRTFLAQSDEQILNGMKSGEEQMALICARHAGKNNRVIQAFCVQKVRPKNLIEFQTALGVAVAPNATQSGGATQGYAIQGHSSSLVGRFVSAVNPRVIHFSSRNNNIDAIAVGFVRGEQLSEIAVRNPDGTFDFFIGAFTQACNASPQHCKPVDLLTPAVESNWTSFTLYDDEDLKNTIVDCRHCHQPDGLTSRKILRMQELRNPWTHWFRTNNGQPDDGVLIQQYQASRQGSTESYGGIPAGAIAGSDPADLENFLRAQGFANEPGNNQPNEFPTGLIATEMGDQGRNAAGRNQNFAVRDAANCKIDRTKASPSPSAVWDALMYNFMNATDACTPTNTAAPAQKRRFIPPPYLRPFVADPAKLDKFTKQYQALTAGTLDKSKFEDHREIFPDDPKVTSQIGFAVDPDLSPQDMLKLACSQCHHSDLDQSLSRAKFNATDFSKMPNLNQELDIAIARVKLGYSPERLKQESSKPNGLKIVSANGEVMEMHKAEHLLAMPPRRFRQLTDTQIDSLVQFLESQKKPQ